MAASSDLYALVHPGVRADVVVLVVGEFLADLVTKSSEDVYRRTDLGTFVRLDTAAEGLELALELLEEDDRRRVLVAIGVMFLEPRGDGREWFGPVISELERSALSIPRGVCAITNELYERLPAEGHERIGWGVLRSSSLVGGSERSLWTLSHKRTGDELSKMNLSRSNLVFEPELLIGRDDELEELGELFARELVSQVTGLPGVGKSSLVRAWARAALVRDPDLRVWWVSLAGCAQTGDLVRQLADLLGLELRPDPARWLHQLMMFFLENEHEQVVIFDEADDLLDDALGWLWEVAKVTKGVRWACVRHLPSTVISAEATARVEALGVDDSVRIIALQQRSRLPTSSIDGGLVDVWRARAERCDGLPQMLRMGGVHGGDSIAGGLELALEAGWRQLTALEQRVLRAARAFHAPFDASALAELSELDVITVRDVLGGLLGSSWVSLAPNASSLRWWLNRSVYRFLGARVFDEVLDVEMTRRHAELMLRDIDGWIVAELGAGDVDAALSLVQREPDVIAALDFLLAEGDRRAASCVARLRAHAARYAHMPYGKILSRALALAGEEGWTRELFELELSELSRQDHLFASKVDAAQRCSEFIARHQRELDPALDREVEGAELVARIGALYTLGTFLGDGASSREDLDAAMEYLRRALAIARRGARDGWCARILVFLGLQYGEFGEVERAAETILEAVEMANSSGSSFAKQRAFFAMHQVLLRQGSTQDSLVYCERALDESRRWPLGVALIVLRASMGYLYLMTGRAKPARALLHEALSLSRINDYLFGVANCSYLLGVAYLLDLEHEAAIEHLMRSWKMNRENDAPYNYHQAEIWLGCARAMAGELDEARKLFESARGFFEEFEHPPLVTTAELLEVSTEIRCHGWVSPDRGGLAQVRAKLDGWELASRANRGSDLGILYRYLASAEDEFSQAPAHFLLVAPGASAFCLPGASERVDLSRRKVLRRLLDALSRHRAEVPGEHLSRAELFSCGWPDDVTQTRAGMMRLYVAISTLRKMGLDELLETYDDGYRLSPDVPIRIEHDMD